MRKSTVTVDECEKFFQSVACIWIHLNNPTDYAKKLAKPGWDVLEKMKSVIAVFPPQEKVYPKADEIRC